MMFEMVGKRYLKDVYFSTVIVEINLNDCE